MMTLEEIEIKLVEVIVPLSLAENLAMFPVNESDITGAVAGVYKHKIQENAKYSTILYKKVSKKNIILTQGESISVGFLNTL